MDTKSCIGGTVHTTPKDLCVMLCTYKKSKSTWEDITPLARNEWICWVISAKQQETRERRIKISMENLAKGNRRPCCWAGCSHRTKNGIKQ